MKKIFYLMVVYTLLILQTHAETFFEPEWYEFCPAKYVNVKQDGFFRTSTAKYWASRKQMFDKRIAQCKTLDSTKQSQCFAELRQLENNTTRMHNDEIKTNAINRASIWGTSNIQVSNP